MGRDLWDLAERHDRGLVSDAEFETRLVSMLGDVERARKALSPAPPRPHSQSPATDSRPRRAPQAARHLGLGILVGLAGAAVLAGTGAVAFMLNAAAPSRGGSRPRHTARTSTPTTAPSTLGGGAAPFSTVGLSPPTKETTFGDGIWQVGTKVVPGTYGAEGGPACHWARVRQGATVASADPLGPTIVTVAATDSTFVTGGCGTWSPLPDAGAQSLLFGDGTWAVGSQIALGTYAVLGGAGCSWERLHDFLGLPGSVTSRGRAIGPAMVTISPGDSGFETAHCGVWHQVG